jgi:ATP-dependent Clp protease ATP-binding subunit ClpA
VLDQKIKEPLTDEILFGDLRKGGTVKVGFEKDRLSFTIKGK